MSRYTVAVTIDTEAEAETVSVHAGWPEGKAVRVDKNPLRQLLALQKAITAITENTPMDDPPRVMPAPPGLHVT